MDVLDVYKAAVEAVEFVRSGKGPILLEMKTYRYRGHSMSDPAKYRSKEEVEDFRENKDPIENLKRKIVAKNYASEAELDEINKTIVDEMNAAIEFAKNSPEPDANELFTDVLA